MVLHVESVGTFVCWVCHPLNVTSAALHWCSSLSVEWDKFCLYSLVLGSCPLSQSGHYTQGGSNPLYPVTTGHSQMPTLHMPQHRVIPLPNTCPLVPTHPASSIVSVRSLIVFPSSQRPSPSGCRGALLCWLCVAAVEVPRTL